MKKILLLGLALLVYLPSFATELYPAIMSYQADRAALARKYNNPFSEEYFQRMDKLYQDWLMALENMPYESYSADGKLDYQLFKNHLEKERFFQQAEWEEFKSVKSVLAFAAPLEKFYQDRRMAIRPKAQELAASFTAVEKTCASNGKRTKRQCLTTAGRKLNSLPR